jgi:putative endonuclease
MNSENQYYVHLLASARHGTLYIGVTNNLLKRVWEHKEGIASAFTSKHKVHKLVWFEVHREIEAAIQREKRLKEWKRDWKISLIEESNPEWIDLSLELEP